PLPPFNVKNKKRDLSYVPTRSDILSIDDSAQTELIPPKKGFHHFRFDTTSKKGLTLFRFQKGFPHVTTVKSMMGPLRYITSNSEYDNLKSSINFKNEIDEFWIENAGTKKRAKKLIKDFYKRVEIANKNFTSHTEGWKTDRGLIYIIYGKPNVVNKTKGHEVWVYGEDRFQESFNFRFKHIKNPFTDNDYLLNRNQLYQSSWYRAVETWRNGRAYTN
ncbi:MAG: GWxTD domain-containing protein, partial [Flavobacteriales bacterium]